MSSLCLTHHAFHPEELFILICFCYGSVVMAVLQRLCLDREDCAEDALRVIGNLAIRVDNRSLLGAVGACEGE